MNQCPNCKSETTTLIREYSNGKLLRTYCWNCGAQGMPDSIESKHRAKPLEDGIIVWMREHGVEPTVENYCAIAYGCSFAELHGELRATLPRTLKGLPHTDVNVCAECGDEMPGSALNLCTGCATELELLADAMLREALDGGFDGRVN